MSSIALRVFASRCCRGLVARFRQGCSTFQTSDVCYLFLIISSLGPGLYTWLSSGESILSFQSSGGLSSRVRNLLGGVSSPSSLEEIISIANSVSYPICFMLSLVLAHLCRLLLD
jgi:hypothetical protein